MSYRSCFADVTLKCFPLFRGKNVCIYHILGSCKFGDTRCVYSHSYEALPKRGWWNSSEKVVKVKEVLEVAERNAKEQRQMEMVRWRTYVKETRGEVRTRASEKQKSKEKVEQPHRVADIDKMHAGSRAAMPGYASEKKGDLKKGDEATGEIRGVQPDGKVTTLAGAPVNSTTAVTKAIARREGKKKVIGPQGGHQKKTEGGANRDASTPSTKNGPQRYHHHRRRNPKSKAASSDLSRAAMAGGEGSTHTKAGGL